MTKNILFRADSSSTIGTGHIMRDLVLASQYKDSNIIFATQDLDGNINHKIIEAGYKLLTLKSNDKDELLELVKNLNTDLLVIDNYEIDYEFERYIKENSDVKILSFDDTYEKHHCDILLNHNISADEKRYKGLVPDRCELRCGSKYTLLRDEFRVEKQKNREKIYDIFIAMGGADTANLNIEILEILPKNLKVALLTTKANKHLEELQNYVKNKKNIYLFVNSNKVAKLINQSKLAIITPSVTINEIFYLNVPFVAIKTVENQRYMYEYLVKHNYKVCSEFNGHLLLDYLGEVQKEL